MTNPGNSSQCQPSTMKSRTAVTKSTTHTIGGDSATKAPTTSEMPAMAMAKASRFFEKRRPVEEGIAGLAGNGPSGSGAGLNVDGRDDCWPGAIGNSSDMDRRSSREFR